MLNHSKDLSEILLDAYLQMYANIKGNRIVANVPFNELVVCGILFHGEERGKMKFSATEIGDYTKILKSQLNKVITSLESQGYVERHRNEWDKRCIDISLTDAGREKYLKEHEAIKKLMDHITSSLGEENTRKLSSLLFDAVEAVESFH